MRFRGVLVALSCAVVAAVAMAPSEANARFVYTAKFMCPDRAGGQANTFGLGGGFIGNIYYETVTTVHNPTDAEQPFNKYFVLAHRQHQLSSFDGLYGANRQSNPVGHILEGSDAIGIDCDSVIFHLNDSGWFPGSSSVNNRIDGMIVIESKSSLLQVQTLYGVVVLANGTPGAGGVTVDVETATPLSVKGRFRLAKD